MQSHELVWDGTANCIKVAAVPPPPTPEEATVPAVEEVVEGSCHCQKVSFRVHLPSPALQALDCNCGICSRKGYLHVTVLKERVDLTPESAAAMTTYRFGTGVAQHTFCATCGVQPLYVPRSNPECYSVNLRCLQTEGRVVRIVPFQGKSFSGRLLVQSDGIVGDQE